MPFGSGLSFVAVALAAVALDRAVGDPPSWPHPVRWIGSLLSFLEPRARCAVADPFLAGAGASLVALAAVFLITQTALFAFWIFSGLVALYLAFSGLALGQLLQEGENALGLLETGDLPAARVAVGELVSRDVSRAEGAELARVLAESLAENVNDAFVAPFFWYVLGGPVGLWLYKTASTMDSMWGYPHEPWTRFGTFAARLDDVLAFIPARLTALFMAAAARTADGFRPWPGYAVLAADAEKMKSPNAGWPMAAAAHLCGGGMGGEAVYAGKIVMKPLLGPPGEPWTPEKLRLLLRLVSRTGWTATAALLLSGLLWRA